MGTSPAQRLMGRRYKTLLPVAGSLLQPQYATEEDTRALIGVKKRQQHYYDKHSKPLPPISKGDTVRMKLLGRNRWDAGICTGKWDPGAMKSRSVTESTDETVDSYLSARKNRIEMCNRRTHYPRKAHCMESQVDQRTHRQKNRVVRAQDQSSCDNQPGKAELQSGTRTITCQGWRNQFQGLYIDTIVT